MELPEIEAIARSLDARLRRRNLKGLRAKREGVLRGISRQRLLAALAGKAVKRVGRLGRYAVICFEGGLALAFQLGSGSVVNLLAAEKAPPNLSLRLDFGDVSLALRGKGESGRVQLVKERDLDSLPGARHSGLDPLSPDCSWPAFSLALAKQKGKIKERLLGGSLVYGLGGIYCDEALFRARIQPGRKVERTSLDERKDLYHSIRDLTTCAVEGYGLMELRPRDSEGWSYPFPICVYRRRNATCTKCKTKIKSVKLGGRHAYYCPYCQK